MAYALDGHPQFELARKVIHGDGRRPSTTEGALAVSYKNVREIQERHRTTVLTYVGTVFATGLTGKAVLDAEDVRIVLAAIPKGLLGTRMAAELGPMVKPGISGAGLGGILNSYVNDSPLTDPTMYPKIIRLYVDIVESPIDAKVRGSLSALPTYELDQVLAAHAIGRTGKTVAIVTSNQVLLESEKEIRSRSSVAAVKTLKQYVADFVEPAPK